MFNSLESLFMMFHFLFLETILHVCVDEASIDRRMNVQIFYGLFCRSFEELSLLPNGTVNTLYRPLVLSMYHQFVRKYWVWDRWKVKKSSLNTNIW